MDGGTLAGIAGIVACLGGSALFSGSETALTTFGRVRTRRLLDEGGPEAEVMRLWDEEPGDVLTTILIFNNAINITASALATEVAHRLLDPLAASAILSPIAVAIGIMTLLLLTFGEIIPKTYARTHAPQLVLPVMRILSYAHRLARPATFFFVRISHWVGAHNDEDDPLVHEEDLTYLVGLGEAEGAISDEQARLLQSVFDLDDCTARQVMVPLDQVVTVPDTIRLPELLHTLVEAGHSRLPVYSGDRRNVVGVCYAKDVLRFVTEADVDATFELRRLCRPPRFVPADRTVDQVLRDMQENHVHLAVVVEHGSVAGIVTLEDVIEELIGEVYDEHDRVHIGFAPAIRRRLRH